MSQEKLEIERRTGCLDDFFLSISQFEWKSLE